MKCTNCGNEFEGNFCPSCGNRVEQSHVQVQPSQPQTNQAYEQPPIIPKPKKPLFKKWWFWVIIAVVVIAIIGNIGSKNDQPKPNDTTSNVSTGNVSSKSSTTSKVNSKPEVTVADFSSMDKEAIQNWATTNKVTCKIEEAYSDSIASGSFVSQSIEANKTVREGDTIKVVFSLGKEPITEYRNALKKAETYSKMMHMSKQGIYDQLTSQYGEKFPADAAQYAIDNLKVDWNANALEKAKSYQKTMSMSKGAIYDQLISKYGEKFTESEAQYAIDHLDD